jgi:hypothetical protein
MSHNVTISSVKFTDTTILAKAVAELAREGGFKAEFVSSKSSFRGWNGRPESADATIRLEGHKYDIGFTKNADGSYSPRFENMFYSSPFATRTTAKSVEDPKRTVNHYNQSELIGRLTQRYAVLTAERNARNNGLSPRRITDKATGQIRLEI